MFQEPLDAHQPAQAVREVDDAGDEHEEQECEDHEEDVEEGIVHAGTGF